MPLDVLQNIRTILKNFNKGIVTYVEDRETAENSLANCVGFNLAERIGTLAKDFGYSKYPTSSNVPSGITAIFGVSNFRIKDLDAEYLVLYGTKADNLPHFWVRGFRGQTFSAGTGTVTATGTAVTGTATVFTTQLSVGSVVKLGAVLRKVITIVSDTSLVVDVAYAAPIGSTAFEYNSIASIDSWVELTEYITATITTVTSSQEYIASSLAGLYADFYLSNFMIVNTTTQQFASVAGSDGTTGGFLIDQMFSSWQVGDTLGFYRFPDTYNLGILGTTVGSSQFYSDSVSRDRLSVGWQRSVPTTETPLLVEYIKRDYMFDGTNPLIKGRIDQIYMGREIPDYSDTSQLGVSFSLEFTDTVPKFPDMDLRKVGWVNQVGSTSNLYQSIDETTPDVTDYVTTTVTPKQSTDFETRIALSSITIPPSGRIRVTARIVESSVLLYKDASSATISVGWYSGLTGTVTSSGLTVTGSGTLFLTELSVGHRISRNDTGETRTITSISSNTSLTVDRAFTTGTAVAVSRIVTLGSRLITLYGYQAYDIDMNIEDITLPGFIGSSVYLTFRYQSYNDKTVNSMPRIVNVIETIETFVASTRVRFIFVPMYNGYMLGRPIYQETTINTASQFYPRMKVDFARMDKRLTDVFVFDDNGNASLNLDQFVSGYRFSIVSLLQNQRIKPFGLVNVWSLNTTDNLYYAQDAGDGENSPEAFTVSRATDDLVVLKDFIGYGIVNDIPNIGDKWRYQTKAALGQQAVVAIDDGDDTLRLCLYDGQNVMNDHIFPDVTTNNSGAPLKLFLSAKGELYAIVGQLGRLYAMKRATIEVIDALSSQSTIYEADVIAKKSCIFTSLGIVYAGKFGIYVFPIHGGLRETLSDAIRPDYLALSDSVKAAMYAIECKDMNAIIFSTSSFQLFYHTEMHIWWKRKFFDTPVSFTRKADNSVIFAASTTPKIVTYPDRSTYTDDTNEVGWVVETQWLDLQLIDVQKTIRSVMPVVSADTVVEFVVNVYVNRQGAPTDSFTSDGTPFFTIYASSVNGIYEQVSNLKIPNSFREIKFVIKKNALDSNIAQRFDLLEVRLYGETSVSGKEN